MGTEVIHQQFWLFPIIQNNLDSSPKCPHTLCLDNPDYSTAMVFLLDAHYNKRITNKCINFFHPEYFGIIFPLCKVKN